MSSLADPMMVAQRDLMMTKESERVDDCLLDERLAVAEGKERAKESRSMGAFGNRESRCRVRYSVSVLKLERKVCVLCGGWREHRTRKETIRDFKISLIISQRLRQWRRR